MIELRRDEALMEGRVDVARPGRVEGGVDPDGKNWVGALWMALFEMGGEAKAGSRQGERIEFELRFVLPARIRS